MSNKKIDKKETSPTSSLVPNGHKKEEEDSETLDV